MTSRTLHLIDPELLPLAQGFPEIRYSKENLAAIRAQFEALASMAPPADADGVVVEERFVPESANAPKVRVMIYKAPQTPWRQPALLHVHGGGYVLGRPELSDAKLKLLARELSCVVISVDYRLPPEHPHPAPIEDSYAALKWVHEQAEMLNVDPDRIAVGGESAGGGLAAALAILARDRGDVHVCFQWLIYPMLDDRTGISDSGDEMTGEFIWTREANRFGWSSLLGTEPGGADVSCYAAPSRVLTVAGLPPAFIAVGSLDLFAEENLCYATRLLVAGIPVEVHMYPGAFHAFDLLPGTKLGSRFESDCVNALKAAFRTTSPS